MKSFTGGEVKGEGKIVATPGVCFILSVLFVFFPVWMMKKNSFSWLVSFGSGDSDFGSLSFYFDGGAFFFGGAVSCVIFQVFCYSRGYMKSESMQKNFFGPLAWFSGSMLTLIFSGDLGVVFLAWDGLGISSFLLVVYYSKSSSSGAGLVTIMTNRLGDICLLLGLSVMGFEVFSGLEGACCFLFIVAAFSKSAQWPLSAWLPAAMAAPTPVSALVHSSTLVTAGVYLLLRFESCCGGVLGSVNPLIEITFFLSCLSACFSYDIKHIIAMSTLGHLSLMILTLSAGFLSATLFHLVSHALFKALTFLAAGNLILGSGHTQDLRLMGGSMGENPLSSLAFWFASLSLSGFFFTSAFFSKDLLLEVFGQASAVSVSFLGVSVVSFFAGVYASNLSDFLDFDGGGCEGSNVEGEPFMVTPLFCLFFCSVFSGWYFSKVLVPFSGIGVSGGVDVSFLIGWLLGSESQESSDGRLSSSMFFLVDGCPETKKFCWEGALEYTKNLEQGEFEWKGGVEGSLVSLGKVSGSWKGSFEW